MPVPAPVDDVVATYLELADAEVGGLVEGLYLVGSVALGDFRPRTSDIDFVAVSGSRLDRAAVTGLGRVHARLRKRWPRPFFDGVYVTWHDLANDPAEAGPGPHTHEGRLHPPGSRGGGGQPPVTWHMVARHGIACRGPGPATLNVHLDPATLAAWTNDNLDAYWHVWLARTSRPLAPHWWFAHTPYAALWLVTGVSRLHYTLATGRITSKEGAARYALTAFLPRWHRVVNEALRIRQADLAGPGVVRALTAAAEELAGVPGRSRSLYRTPRARRRDVLAFGDMAIRDAHQIYQGR